jgi:hypothetical protein
MQNNMQNTRRTLCKSLLSMPWMIGVSGCAAGTPKVQWSPEEQERMHRFRGINGYEFTLSGAEEPIFVRILGDKGRSFGGIQRSYQGRIASL